MQMEPMAVKEEDFLLPSTGSFHSVEVRAGTFWELVARLCSDMSAPYNLQVDSLHCHLPADTKIPPINSVTAFLVSLAPRRVEVLAIKCFLRVPSD